DYKSKEKKLTKQQKKRIEKRKERREAKKLRNVRKHYGKIQTVRNISPYKYRVVLVRTGQKKKAKRYYNITGLVENISWSESSAVLTGSLSVRDALPAATRDRGVKV